MKRRNTESVMDSFLNRRLPIRLEAPEQSSFGLLSCALPARSRMEIEIIILRKSRCHMHISSRTQSGERGGGDFISLSLVGHKSITDQSSALHVAK